MARPMGGYFWREIHGLTKKDRSGFIGVGDPVRIDPLNMNSEITDALAEVDKP